MNSEHQSLHRRHIVACLWDFDKTLSPGYMQEPLFGAYGIDAEDFWKEVNGLPEIYAKRGTKVSSETVYLNHLLNHIKNGKLRGLTNQRLRELGAKIPLYDGLPNAFESLKTLVSGNPKYQKYDIQLEHYILSTGLTEMIRGSAVADHVEDIFGCEFIENPLPPDYKTQLEAPLEGGSSEISQIGTIVDNTIKTRYVFEINKGTNKDPAINVNARIEHSDRRVPIKNMIYIADGPSDIPVFSVVGLNGGHTLGVWNPKKPKELKQNENKELKQNEKMQKDGRIKHYSRADYRLKSDTYQWLELKINEICENIIRDYTEHRNRRISSPPQHLH